MGLKEDLKKALKEVGVIDYDDFERYGFMNIENWPEVDFVKEDYENYQKHPEKYNFIKEGASFDDFIEATVGHEMYEPGMKEGIDCENFGFIKFEASDNKIELEVYAAGDWQPPHIVKVTFENNKLSAEDLGRADGTKETSDEVEEKFLDYIGLMED